MPSSASLPFWSEAALIVVFGRIPRRFSLDGTKPLVVAVSDFARPQHHNRMWYIRVPFVALIPTVILPSVTDLDIPFDNLNVTKMDCTAQWIHDVSAVTANAARSHPHPNDVDTTSPCSISSKHPQHPSRISMRNLTPDGSESSCPLSESGSGPIDEVGSEAGSLESPGPDDLDEPWPYTFRVSQSPSSAAGSGR